MRFLSRYLELLATAQFYRSEQGQYSTDESAFFFSGLVMSFIPILHAVVALAAIEALASALHVGHTGSWGVRLLICAPFLAASIWVGSNATYLQVLRSKIRADQPAAAAQRHRESKYFVVGSYILGVTSFVYLATLQAMMHGTLLRVRPDRGAVRAGARPAITIIEAVRAPSAPRAGRSTRALGCRLSCHTRKAMHE